MLKKILSNNKIGGRFSFFNFTCSSQKSTHMKNFYKQFRISLIAASAAMILFSSCTQKEEKPAGLTKEEMIARGKYLTTIASCQDCHSPKIMTPQGPIVDETRAFSGAPADSKLPRIDTTEITPGKWYLGSSD